MSNPDSFFNEVTEELRRERMFAVMRKYGWIAVVLVLLLVGGAAWNEWRKAQAQAEARAFGDRVITALQNDDAGARAAALSSVEAGGERAGILQLLTAAAALEADDRAGTLQALASVEADGTLPMSYRQIAALKRVIIGGTDIPADERQSTLAGLAAPGGAFRPLALEQLALLAMETGDREGALTQSRTLLNEPDLTPALRQRIAQLIVVLGGDQPSDLG